MNSFTRLSSVGFLSVMSICLFGQIDSLKVDSLKNALNTAKGVTRFDVLYELAYWYSNEIDSVSLVYATRAYDLALTIGDSARIIKGGRIKVAQLRRTERIDESIRLAKRILPIAKRHNAMWEANVLITSLAISYTQKAEYDEALKYNLENLALLEAAGEKKAVSMMLNNIGVIYYKLSDFKNSLEYYKRALNLKRQSNDKLDLDLLLINMGLCLNADGNPIEARKYVSEGLNSCDGKCTDQKILEGEIAFGMISYDEGLYDESLKHLNASYQIAKRISNFRFQAENLVCLSRVYLEKRNYPLALKSLTEAETISKKRGYKFLLIDVYELFSKLYGETKDYEKTILCQSKYIVLKDSVFNKKVMANLSKLHADFQERENVRTIAEKNNVLLLREELIEKQRLQVVLAISIAFLLALVALILYRIYRDKLLVSVRLEQKVKERTEDLRINNKRLTSACELLQSRLHKIGRESQKISSSIAGLCHTAQLELDDKRAIEYLQRITDSATRLPVLFEGLEDGHQIT